MMALKQAARIGFFRRSALFDIAFDQRAAADAALIIVGWRAIGYLWDVLYGRVSFSGWALVLLPVSSLMVWIVRAGVCLLVAKVLFQKESSLSTVMKVHGFAYLPLVLTFLPPLGLIGIVWFLAVLVFATAEGMALDWWQSAVTIATSVVGLYLISPLFWGAPRLF
jgi:hypothetical protein